MEEILYHVCQGRIWSCWFGEERFGAVRHFQPRRLFRHSTLPKSHPLVRYGPRL